MDFVIVQTLNGLVFGILLFLSAAGLTLVLGVMDIIKIPAHGSFFLFGGYIGYAVAKHTGSFLLGCLSGVLVTGILGIISYWAILRRSFAKDVLAQVLITFGMLLIVTEVCRWIWGRGPSPDHPTRISPGVPLPGDDRSTEVPAIGHRHRGRCIHLPVVVPGTNEVWRHRPGRCKR